MPAIGLVSVIHEGLADAVQSHVGAEAVRVMLPLTPLAGASTLEGDTENVQGVGAAAS